MIDCLSLFLIIYKGVLNVGRIILLSSNYELDRERGTGIVDSDTNINQVESSASVFPCIARVEILILSYQIKS